MDGFRDILVAIDLNKESNRTLLTRACQLTDPDNIEVAHVCNHLQDRFAEYGVGEFSNTKELGERIAADADAKLVVVCEKFGVTHRHILGGDVAGAIHEYSADHTDLVIVGSHGRNSLQTLFGSTSNAMIRGTPCDVLAVNISDNTAKPPENYNHLLVAVDLTEESNLVIDHALNIALKQNAMVSLCHAYVNYGGYKRAQERYELETMAFKYNIPIDDVYSLNGSAAARVQALAAEINADLVVVGTHGKRGMVLFAGSTANAMLHGAHCDTLSVKVGGSTGVRETIKNCLQ